MNENYVFKDSLLGDSSNPAGITVNEFTKWDAKNHKKQDIAIQFLEFANQSSDKPVRICHLGVFATAIA